MKKLGQAGLIPLLIAVLVVVVVLVTVAYVRVQNVR